MKILIIANSSIVFGKELKDELISNDCDTTLMDFESLKIYDKDNQEDTSYYKYFLKYKNIPKISMLFRIYYIKKIIQEGDFDTINIHVSRWFYLPILRTLSKKNLIITFYGSDFYRTSNFIKNIQKPLYRKASKITFTNPLTKKSFLEYYNQFNEKCYVCRFGLKTLDYIDKNRKTDLKKIKNELGYSCDKLIVTCGYNSTKAQQHNKIIDNLQNLPNEVLSKVQFIFPLTYGDNINKEHIKQRLKSTNLDYIILEDFLYEDKNAYIKLASDIMINILQTDSFSGSMQEFLYAKNIVITGAWLPYELFDTEGIQYLKIDNPNSLKNELENIIINQPNIELNKNKNIIYKLSSWKNNIKYWISVYAN